MAKSLFPKFSLLVLAKKAKLDIQDRTQKESYKHFLILKKKVIIKAQL